MHLKSLRVKSEELNLTECYVQRRIRYDEKSTGIIELNDSYEVGKVFPIM